MDNAELIKGLRWCADESICCDDFSGEKCPYFDEKKDSCSVDEILHAAADALEAADKRIAELSLDNKMLKNAIDADKGVMLDRIRFLEAQLPREGEWLRTDAFPHRIYCSVCYKTYVPNDRWQIWVDDELPRKYCPNCGSRMREGEQE